MAEVKVYYSKTCPVCHRLMDYLNDNNIEYESFEVTEDEMALNYMLEKTEQAVVPQIEINGKFLVGFDRNKIDKELENA